MAKKVQRELSVKMTGDSKGFVAASGKATDSGKRYEKQVKKINAANKTYGESFRRAANSTTVLNGPLNGVSGRLSAVSTGIATVGAAGLAAGVSIAAFVATLGAAANAGGALEVEMGRLEAIVKSTGATAGFSASQIDEQSRAIGRNTLSNAAEMRKAAGILLTFRTIQGQTFKETLMLTQDMAAVMGTSASAAAVQFGKALEDPATGLTALKRSGVSFTDQEKEVIKALQESGKLFEAQAIVIAKLKTQIGGAGEGQNKGLVGAVDFLGENWTELLERIDKTTGTSKVMAEFFNTMARGASVAGNLIDESDIDKQARLFRELLELRTKDAPNPRAARANTALIAAKEKELLAVGNLVEKARVTELEAYNKSQASQAALDKEMAKGRKVLLDKSIADELAAQQAKVDKLREQALLSEGLRVEAENAKYGRQQAALATELQAITDKGIISEEIEQSFRDRALLLEQKHQADLVKAKAAQAKDVERVEAAKAKTEKVISDKRATAQKDFYGTVATLSSSSNKKLAAIGKAAAMRQATIDGIAAVQRVFKDLPTPYNIPAAAAMAGITAANVAKIGGIAHGGLDNVPSESTYLLDKGERVLSPNQNKDLTKFLAGGGGGGAGELSVVINNAPAGSHSVSREDDKIIIDLAVAKVVNDISRGGSDIASVLENTYSMQRTGARR